MDGLHHIVIRSSSPSVPSSCTHTFSTHAHTFPRTRTRNTISARENPRCRSNGRRAHASEASASAVTALADVCVLPSSPDAAAPSTSSSSVVVISTSTSSAPNTAAGSRCSSRAVRSCVSKRECACACVSSHVYVFYACVSAFPLLSSSHLTRISSLPQHRLMAAQLLQHRQQQPQRRKRRRTRARACRACACAGA